MLIDLAADDMLDETISPLAMPAHSTRIVLAAELKVGDTILGKSGGVVTSVGLCARQWRNYLHVSVKGQPVKCYWDNAEVMVK